MEIWPNERLKQIQQLLEEGGQSNGVWHASEALFVWLAKGGFMPNWRACPLAAAHMKRFYAGSRSLPKEVNEALERI